MSKWREEKNMCSYGVGFYIDGEPTDYLEIRASSPGIAVNQALGVLCGLVKREEVTGRGGFVTEHRELQLGERLEITITRREDNE